MIKSNDKETYPSYFVLDKDTIKMQKVVRSCEMNGWNQNENVQSAA